MKSATLTLTCIRTNCIALKTDGTIRLTKPVNAQFLKDYDFIHVMVR